MLAVTQKKTTIKKKVIFHLFAFYRNPSFIYRKSAAALTRTVPCASNPHSFEAEPGYRMRQ